MAWVDIAEDQYQALSGQQQRLIDVRVAQLLEDPENNSSDDRLTDQWTTTDSASAGVITFVFRSDRARLVILRLI